MVERIFRRPVKKIINPPKPRPQTLGGAMFIHNAIELDYCVAEALDSLCAVCDQVVCIEAESTDGTMDLLKVVQNRNPNLKIVQGTWECASNFERLRMLADQAKSYLKTDWQFQLQGDEVIHENSFYAIRKAIQNPNFNSYMVRRMNLWGDCNHYLKYDIPQEHKPVSDEVVRLAKLEFNAHGDAESLAVDHRFLGRRVDEITIFHYGFVRNNFKMVDKTISMQSWFWGPGSSPDHRVVKMKEEGTGFDWTVMKTRDLLDRIPMDHPKFSKAWAETRQAEKIPVE